MRRHRSFATAILVSVLVVANAAPAHATTRLRVYRGPTSQDQTIAFRVVRNDNGRFIKELRMQFTLTCEDATTQDWGVGYYFGGRGIPITDGVFSFDDVNPFNALHLSGQLGWLHGEGTFSMAAPSLTADEQAQLCTTGDLTWEVEYVRTITRPEIARRATTVRITSDTGRTLRLRRS
jgi:hypothetical protein